MAMNLCLAAISLFFSALADSPTTPHRAGHHPLSCWYICPPRLAGGGGDRRDAHGWASLYSRAPLGAKHRSAHGNKFELCGHFEFCHIQVHSLNLCIYAYRFSAVAHSSNPPFVRCGGASLAEGHTRAPPQHLTRAPPRAPPHSTRVPPQSPPSCALSLTALFPPSARRP